eukprot:GAHX01002067.1.p1 GENE.GAHX01002067.1~~GAHX01002067.1.p1  ORF type:complete len:1461 (+),score=271.35 GAHX01002067.1:83-4465(+)
MVTKTSNEENILCQVCFNGDVEFGNEIVICHQCNIAVHQACYGIVSVPTMNWFCETCSEQLSRPGEFIPRYCLLCPITTGAFKKITDSNNYVHVCCALVHNGPWVVGEDKMLSISGLEYIKESLFTHRCMICRKVKGATIVCTWPRCNKKFHVLCAYLSAQAHIYILDNPTNISYIQNIKTSEDDTAGFVFYCEKHNEELLRKLNTKECLNSGVITVSQLKAAFKPKRKKQMMKIDITIPEKNLLKKNKLQCEICCSKEGDFLSCSNCLIQVHENCYYPLKRPPLLPSSKFKTKTEELKWVCDFCYFFITLKRKKYSNSCIVCAGKGGPMKATIEGDFVHLVCALSHCIFELIYTAPNFLDVKFGTIDNNIKNTKHADSTPSIVLNATLKKCNNENRQICTVCSKLAYNGTLEPCVVCNKNYHASCAVDMSSLIVMLECNTSTIYFSNEKYSILDFISNVSNIYNSKNYLTAIVCFNCKKGLSFNKDSNKLISIESSYFNPTENNILQYMIPISYGNESQAGSLKKLPHRVLFDKILATITDRTTCYTDTSSIGRLITHNRAEFSLAKTKSSDGFWDGLQNFNRELNRNDIFYLTGLLSDGCASHIDVENTRKLINKRNQENGFDLNFNNICNCFKCISLDNPFLEGRLNLEKLPNLVSLDDKKLEVEIIKDGKKIPVLFNKVTNTLEQTKNNIINDLLSKLNTNNTKYMDTTKGLPNLDVLYYNRLHSCRIKLLVLLLNAGLNDFLNVNKLYLNTAKGQIRKTEYCCVCFGMLRAETDLIFIKCSFCNIKAHKICTGETSSAFDTSAQAVWTCENCQNNQKAYNNNVVTDERACAFCNFEGLLLKSSINGIFAHLICFIIESQCTKLVDIFTLSFIVNQQTIRHKYKCSHCNFSFKSGMGIGCSGEGCKKRYHSLCAWKKCCVFDFSGTFNGGTNDQTKIYCCLEHIPEDNRFKELYGSNLVNLNNLQKMRTLFIFKEFEEYGIANIQTKRDIFLSEEDLIFSSQISKPKFAMIPSLSRKNLHQSIQAFQPALIADETPGQRKKITAVVTKGNPLIEVEALDNTGLTNLSAFKLNISLIIQLRNINSMFPDRICNICLDSILISTNFTLIRCHSCGIYVHEECYYYGRQKKNVVKVDIPVLKDTGGASNDELYQVFCCDFCRLLNTTRAIRTPSCIHCNLNGSSFIVFNNKVLIHAACIFWNPDNREKFLDGEYEKLLHNFQNSLTRKKSCYICKKGNGTLIRCMKDTKLKMGITQTCERYFHVTCGMLANCNIFYIYDEKAHKESVYSYCTSHINVLEIHNRKLEEIDKTEIHNEIRKRSLLLFIDTLLQKEKTKVLFRINEAIVFYKNLLKETRIEFAISKFEFAQVVMALYFESKERKIFNKGFILKKRLRKDGFDYLVYFYEIPFSLLSEDTNEKIDDKASKKGYQRKRWVLEKDIKMFEGGELAFYKENVTDEK